jgi:hypothetical protein
MSAIPYTGASVLGRIAARTTVARVLLAIALVALVVLTALAARHPRLDKTPLVPANSGGIVVLDLSASISSDTYSRIGQELQRLVDAGGRYGLVVFSVDAYEALPPGTPSSAIQPLIRYFTLPTQVAPGEQPSYPRNPWTQSFTGGTQIARGLQLALQIEAANHVKKKSVILISDLADDPNDLSRLNDVLAAYKHDKIKLLIVPLNAATSDLQRFSQVAVKTLATPSPGTHPPKAAPARASFPTLLVALTVVVALLLGVNEVRSARLRWGEGRVEAAGEPA